MNVLNDALLQQQGFVYRDDSCFQSHLLTAALPVFSSSLIQHHKRLYIHLPQLPSIPPNPTPPSDSLLAPDWSGAWGFKEGSRGLEQTGMREETWKEKSWGKKEEAGEGCAREKNATEWSNDLATCAIVRGREGGAQRHGESKKKMGGKGRGSPRPSGGLSSLWFFLPLFHIFYTKCPHTKP